MRARASRFLPLTLGVITVCLFLVLKAHLYVLSQVLYTYATFHSQNHGILNIPVDPPSTTSAPVTPAIPPIIHQIWLDEHDTAVATPHIVTSTSDDEALNDAPYNSSTIDLPLRYAAGHQSCANLHPDWEFKLWTSADANAFVSREYPSIHPHYQSYRQTIQRTNILLYLVLHHYGGVYIDLDITCRRTLEPLRSVDWLTPAAHPAGINNAFIMSKQRHPFLTSLIARIESHNLWWPSPYIENMLSTGCMFISMEYARFGGWDKKAAGLQILGLDGLFDAHMLRGLVVTPLFEHAGESSWHRWDGKIMLVAGRHWQVILVVTLIVAIGISSCAWKLSRRSGMIRLGKGSNC